MKEKNFSFLKGIDDNDRIMLNRLLDWIQAAEEKYMRKFSFFMNERQLMLCRQVLMSVKFENYILWGGYENAQRCVIGIYPPYADMDTDDFPIKAVTMDYRREDKLTHRDFLGSLMGMKISRECVGDILVGEGRSCVFLTDTAAQDVMMNLRKVGRVGVKVHEGFYDDIAGKTEFEEISGTAASLRADCVLSLALGISREKAAALVKNTGIEINYILYDTPKTMIKVNDKFSVRGHGKFILRSVNGETKRNRLHITVCKYI